MTLKKNGSLFVARCGGEVKVGSLARCTTWLGYKADTCTGVHDSVNAILECGQCATFLALLDKALLD